MDNPDFVRITLRRKSNLCYRINLMNSPNLREEKKLWKKGYKYVVGLDEAGRGPLAGPVVAAAVVIKNPKSEIRNPKSTRIPLGSYGIPEGQILNSKFKFSKQVWNFKHWDLDIVSNFVLRASDLKIRDSKKLSSRAREKFYKILTTHPGILWGLGRVSEKVIDKINILEATKLAMARAISKIFNLPACHRFAQANAGRQFSIFNDDIFLILDGNFTLPAKALAKAGINLPIPQKAIIKGDEKVFSCAAASILAKVSRDRLMEKYDKKYPQYGFRKHKGYPTLHHKKMLRKYGHCEIHRKSFMPVQKISNSQ